MNEPSELERLITRVLDEEASAAERGALEQQSAADPTVAQLLAEYRRLDRHFCAAMRSAVPRHAPPRTIPLWHWATQMVTVAAAAGLALLLWIRPPAALDGAGADVRASLFADVPVPATDQFDPNAGWRYERPGVRLDDANGDWIVIPGQRPDEYLIFEVKRIKSRTVFIQRDF